MPGSLRELVLPPTQRRTLDDLTADLDLLEGDTRSKRSAFWVMLTISSVIASVGVLDDSTATVIGAMIIAPLSTPIMGFALSMVKRQRNRSAVFVLAGAGLVVAVGLLFSMFLPGDYDILDNEQIAGRTSPELLDLVAAIATGFAGALALARRDVGAVLPGVAIAISLVPPLAVIGVCLGAGQPNLAVGAFWLFFSNLLALVLAGTLVFAALGYAADSAAMSGRPRRRAYVTLAALIMVVLVPLTAHTVVTYYLDEWSQRIEREAATWISGEPGAELIDVDLVHDTFVVQVRTEGGLPQTDLLLSALDGQVPTLLPIAVETTRGRRIELTAQP